MSKTKALILMAFVLALGAGVAVGMLGSRALPSASEGRARFIQEMNLTAAQEQQMKEIWLDLMRTKGREYGEAFRSIQQERETAIQGLFNADQKQQFDAINRQFAQRTQDLWKRAEQDFDGATQKTRQILDPAQQKKFDDLIARFRTEHDRGDWGGMGMGFKPTTAPSDSMK